MSKIIKVPKEVADVLDEVKAVCVDDAQCMSKCLNYIPTYVFAQENVSKLAQAIEYGYEVD